MEVDEIAFVISLDVQKEFLEPGHAFLVDFIVVMVLIVFQFEASPLTSAELTAVLEVTAGSNRFVPARESAVGSLVTEREGKAHAIWVVIPVWCIPRRPRFLFLTRHPNVTRDIQLLLGERLALLDRDVKLDRQSELEPDFVAILVRIKAKLAMLLQVCDDVLELAFQQDFLDLRAFASFLYLLGCPGLTFGMPSR